MHAHTRSSGRRLALGAIALGVGLSAAWRAGLFAGAKRSPADSAASGGAAAVRAAPDSLRAERPGGFVEVEPAARVVEPGLGELSGLARVGGAWYAHNDSGDGPIVYRAATLDFAGAERLPLEGARAVDWEEIAAWGDDLLICDIGDNGRKRDDLMLYRARYHPVAGGPAAGGAPRGADDGDGDGARASAPAGRLELIAAYPIRYPDGRHDAEGAFVLDDRVHIVTKQRGEPETTVFRFERLEAADALAPGEANVPVRIGALAIGDGEQVTAADLDPRTGLVAVLTYAQVLLYPRDRLDGAPAHEVLLGARQCEAVCWDGDAIVIANEQREVLRVDGVLARVRGGLRGLVPPRDRARLPARALPAAVDGHGGAWRSEGAALPLARLGEGEEVRWVVADDRLHLAARLRAEAEPVPTAAGGPLGSGLLFAVGRGDERRLGAGDTVLLLGCEPDGAVRLFELVTRAGRLVPEVAPAGLGVAVGRTDGVWLELEASLSVARVLGEPRPGTVRVAACVYRLRRDPDEDPCFGARSAYDLTRPYLWGEVDLGAP